MAVRQAKLAVSFAHEALGSLQLRVSSCGAAGTVLPNAQIWCQRMPESKFVLENPDFKIVTQILNKTTIFAK